MRFSRSSPRRPDYARPRLRLWTMVFLLVLLALYIPRARDPRSWSWLTNSESTESSDYTPPPTPSRPADKVTAHRSPLPEASSEPLDQEQEEIESFQEQAEVILDRKLYLRGIEMPAYWRLVRWAQASPLAKLEPRASRSLVFNDFAQRPAKLRGKLVRLKLNVRRVLPCAVEESQPPDIKPLYEVWGFSEESQGWLYVVVTPELPAGLQVGTSVNEDVTVCGFFMKLQGYHPGGAKPNDRPLYAPLLVGRMELTEPLPPPQATQHATWWLVAAGGVGLGAVALVWLAVRRARPSRRLAADGPSGPLPWQNVEDEATGDESSWSGPDDQAWQDADQEDWRHRSET